LPRGRKFISKGKGVKGRKQGVAAMERTLWKNRPHAKGGQRGDLIKNVKKGQKTLSWKGNDFRGLSGAGKVGGTIMQGR